MIRRKTQTLGLAAIAALMCTPVVAAEAVAQGGNIARFTINAESAKIARTRDEVSFETARRIGDACFQFAQQRNRRVSIFVLSPAGQVVYSARMDGQGPVQVDTALMKAKSALYMRDSTRAWSNRLYDNIATEVRWLKLDQYWVPGGLPIVVDDVLIGAVGVGGADLDEECANAGLTQVIGPQPPLAPVIPPRPLPERPAEVPHVQ